MRTRVDLKFLSHRSTVLGFIPDQTAMPYQEILNRPDGSQVRLLVQDYAMPGQPADIGVDVFRRSAADQPWHLCPRTPDAQFMSAPEAAERDRQEAQHHVKPTEMIAAVSRFHEAQRNAPPPFMPWLRGDAGSFVYDDGRVFGSVTMARHVDGAAVVIHEWRSNFPGQGHTTEALLWMRRIGVRNIEVHGVDALDPGGASMDSSLTYWAHMMVKGLVDRAFDDNGYELQITESGQLEAATPRGFERQRA